MSRRASGCAIVGAGVLLLLGLFLVRIVRQFHGQIWDFAATSFLEEECRSGVLPRDSAAFLRSAPLAARDLAHDSWITFDAEAWVVDAPAGPRLRVRDRYLWPFTIEEPLDPRLVRCSR